MIEHTLAYKNDPYSIEFSRFTIKIKLSPFEWFVDHLHKPIQLSTSYHSQMYNWYHYKAACYNFIYLWKNTHKCFAKYLKDPSAVLEMVELVRRQ